MPELLQRVATAGMKHFRKLGPQPALVQLGVRNDEAAALAEANGLKVVMNRWPKIEYGRLSSEIAWMGVNTRTVTSKRAKIGGRAFGRSNRSGHRRRARAALRRLIYKVSARRVRGD